MYTTDKSTWTAINSGDRNNEIYVVYKKKNDIKQGGTPTVKQSGDVNPPVAPRINKESTPNGDDTNTLALSLISDTAKLEVEKLADVIVVFDVSTSMEENKLGKVTRLEAAKKAVKDLAEHLSTKKNSNGDPLVRMSLIDFSTKAGTVLGMKDLTDSGNNNGLNQIRTAVNKLTADGGTNWDHALQLANEENDFDPGRATFVIFVTDGDPTFRNARMNVTDADLAEEKNYHEGYTFLNAAIDNNGIFSLQEGTATGSGTINESNTQYTVTYNNQASTQQVYIHKTGQDGKTPLKGAVFSLYSKKDYEAEPKKAMKTDLTSDELGKIDLGRLAVGEYYLVETKAPDGYNLLTEPVKITVKGKEVSYQQIENSMSISNNGVSGNNQEGYTLVVTNNEGYELPSTGGPGTRLFTILGTALIAGAGILLWMSRKSADFTK